MDDDLDDEETAVETPRAVSKPPARTETHKDVLDFQEGFDECYWCSKVMKKENMSRQRSHNSVVFICGDCQPK